MHIFFACKKIWDLLNFFVKVNLSFKEISNGKTDRISLITPKSQNALCQWYIMKRLWPCSRFGYILEVQESCFTVLKHVIEKFASISFQIYRICEKHFFCRSYWELCVRQDLWS